jgi:hypothetical protein
MGYVMSTVATDEQVSDARPTARVPRESPCRCASEEWCEKHHRACPCSDSFGNCRRGCLHCAGDGMVTIEDALKERCLRCTENGNPPRFRGLGGVR